MNKKQILIPFATILIATFSTANALADENNNPPQNRVRAEVQERRDFEPTSSKNKEEIGTNSSSDDNEEMGTSSTSDDREENESTSTPEKSRGEQHRSAVANFVHSLLDAASSTPGELGLQIREVAKEQNDSEEKVTKAADAVEKRSHFLNFLIGSDYKNLGVLRSEMVKTQARLDQLNRIVLRVGTSTIPTSTSGQIQKFKSEQNKLADFVKQYESKFSLFGWFTKLFNK